MNKLFLFLISAVISLSCTACQKPLENGNPVSQSETTQAQEEKTITKEVAFYYPDEAVMYLCPETILVNTRESEFLEAIVETIIKGPVSKELNPAISGKVNVLSVKLKNGICTVDLSNEFITHNTGGSTKETMAIYSIVNTLCGIDGIEKVKINIEGNENPDFGGHFDLSEPLDPDFSIIKNQQG